MSTTTTATTTLIKSGAAFLMTINTLNFIRGTAMLAGPKTFTPKAQSTALAESQIRYLASMTAALGAIGWWAAGDLQERQVPLALAGVGAFVGGLGRAFAGFKHGFEPSMTAAMWAELAIPVGIWGVGWVQGAW